MSEKKETPILKTEHLTKMFPVKKRKLIEKQKYVHAAEDVSFEVYRRGAGNSWENPVPVSPRWPERSLR